MVYLSLSFPRLSGVFHFMKIRREYFCGEVGNNDLHSVGQSTDYVRDYPNNYPYSVNQNYFKAKNTVYKKQASLHDHLYLHPSYHRNRNIPLSHLVDHKIIILKKIYQGIFV